MKRLLGFVTSILMATTCAAGHAQVTGQVRFTPAHPVEGAPVQVQVDLENFWDMQEIVVEVLPTEILIRLRALQAANPSVGIIGHRQTFTAPAAASYPFRVVIEEYFLGDVLRTVATGTLTVRAALHPRPFPIPAASSTSLLLLALLALIAGCGFVRNGRV